MGDYTIIQYIEEAIIALLENKLGTLSPVPLVTNDSPADIKKVEGSNQKLSFYLYRIEENSHMKNLPREKPDPSHLKKQSLYLDLFFMLTPYASNKMDEHKILGRAMQVLHDRSILKSTDVEVGGTVFSTLDEEIRITFGPITLDDHTKIWSALKDIPYKLSTCYKVTTAKIDSELSDEVVRVREKDIEYYMAKGSISNDVV